MGSFKTSDEHPGRHHRPIRVATLKQDIFGAAREMCEDLDTWTVLAVDEDACSITCERNNGFLGGVSTIVVLIDGPDGIPSSTTNVRSQSKGGLVSRDKAIVAEFVKKFTMRVC